MIIKSLKTKLTATGCCLCLFASMTAQEEIMKTKPYLQNPTNNRITVSWLTNYKVHSWVEYGIHPVVIGGGPQKGDATVMILEKNSKEMTLKTLNDLGYTLCKIAL